MQFKPGDIVSYLGQGKPICAMVLAHPDHGPSIHLMRPNGDDFWADTLECAPASEEDRQQFFPHTKYTIKQGVVSYTCEHPGQARNESHRQVYLIAVGFARGRKVSLGNVSATPLD